MTKPTRSLADWIALLVNKESSEEIHDTKVEQEVDQEVQLTLHILQELEEQENKLDSMSSKLDDILKQLTASSLLSSIKIQFGDKSTMALGPVTIQVGQTVTATVQGFDQNGAPFTGPLPAITFSVDNSAVASSTPSADGTSSAVMGVSAGVANFTASLTSAEGTALSDTETVTVQAQPSILSSIKVDFA